MGNPFFVYSNKDGESGTGYLYIKTPKGIQSLKNINRAEQRHRHRRGTLSGKEKIIFYIGGYICIFTAATFGGWRKLFHLCESEHLSGGS